MAENLTFNLDVDSSKAVASINTFFDTFDKGATMAKNKMNKAFGEPFQTEIRVEFKNGQLVAKEVQSLKQDSNKLAAAYKAVNGEMGKTPNQLKRQRDLLRTLLGDTQKFKSGTKNVTAEWKTLTDKIKQTETALKNMGDGGGGGLAALTSRFIGIQTAANLATAGIMNLARGVGDLVKTAFRMETLSLQMEAFTGGAAQAEAAFDQFVEIASNSPLNLEQVAGAGKIMMAFGMSTEDAIKATEQLALVSAATGGDINLLSRNMGQIVAQGRAYTRDLTQFAIQGIPIWEQLSVATGKSVSELKDMAREGRITGTEVSAALDLMTREGTQFFEIGERIQETFAGRFAAIQAATQDMAKEFIDAFNLVDQALGGPVSNGMKAFADGLNLIANNFSTIGAAASAAAIGLGTFFVFLGAGKLIAIVNALGGIATAFGLVKASILTSLGAQLALMGAMGPAAWASAAAGIAAAGIAFVAIKGKIEGATQKQNELKGEIAGMGTATGELTEAQIAYAEKVGDKKLLQAYKDQQKEAEGINQELARAIEILKEQQTQRNANFDEEQQDIKDLMALEKDKMDRAKQARDQAKDEINAKYEQEKTRLGEVLSLIREKAEAEIGALRNKTPAEQALYELQKSQLRQKLEAGGLNKEEELSLRARLERMEANEKIQKLIVKQKEDEKKVTDEIEKLEKDRKKALAEIENKYKDIARESKAENEELKQRLRDSEDAQDAFNKKIEQAITNSKSLNTSVNDGTRAVGNQITEVGRLAGAYRNAALEAANLATQIRNANTARGESAQGGTGTNSGTTGTTGVSGIRFAGGPVAGGSTYQVNELGQEAFLSASGALSMINAPSFGHWKAPGSGTVIPAHLTKQLSIPAGGVNVGNTSKAAASGGSSEISRMLRVLEASSRGSNINNSVTIQSSNPTQTANNMLVQLQKIRRGRYNR